jgi:hypothetical protein
MPWVPKGLPQATRKRIDVKRFQSAKAGMPFIKKRILDRRNRKSYIAPTLKFGFGRHPQSLQEEAAGDFFGE